ncbi:MAG: glycosyltransferase [Bradymonadaceae bacterium]|nr:glycosyltransferase [Lujinxingiaceae bacterium]
MTQESMFSQRLVYPLMYVAQSSRRVASRHGLLLKRLQNEGFDVHVLAADDGGFEELERYGIVGRPLPVALRANVAGLLGAYFIMQAYFLEKRPVLVHVFDQPLAWPAAFAARQADAAAVVATVDRHSMLALTDLAAIEGLLAQVYGLLGRLVDRYIVTNAQDLELARGLGIVETDKLELVDGDDAVEQILGLYDGLLSSQMR